MSSNSYNGYCFKCGNNMDMYQENKPFPYVSGECLECGFLYYTTVAQLTLEEVNEARSEHELEPLKQLKVQGG